MARRRSYLKFLVMKTRFRSCLLTGFSVLLFGGGAVAEETAFRFGAAGVDITPANGTPLAGYYHERGTEGVLDPIYCRAMVIESGASRAALVSLDLIRVTREVTDTARELAQQATGIPAAHILVSATHAHTGPELADRSERAGALGGDSPLARAYTDQLPQRICQAVQRAVESLKQADLKWGEGACEGLAFNRRYFMRDGSVGWNPGKLNPDIMLPAGLTDPQMGLVYAEESGANNPSRALGAYVNFAMHPDTTGGSRVSADWPGALGRVLAAYHGSSFQTLVGNGACGNVNHLDFAWSWPNSGPAEQNRIATLLGATVFRSYKSLELLRPEVIRGRVLEVELPLAPVSAEEAAAARELLAVAKDDRGAPFMKVVRAYRAVDIDSRKGAPLRPEVQVIALGRQLAWVGLPGEVFVELGLAIKKRSPFAHTMVVSLANEDIGYIPDRRSYAEGNYEPESARCAAGSGERLAAAAADLLEALHKAAEASPTRDIQR